jgi:DNA polymerase III subunit gamma/tau
VVKKKSPADDAGSPPWETDEPTQAGVSTVPQGPGLFGDAAPVAGKPYVVLARKYRPQAFPDLIGQEAMVTTLRNAFASGRIAQGYMLTGVRGVGKTTTARILARGLNYEINGQTSGPTVDMPVLGRHCADIIASRHPDVVEMDAASNTGIENIREIIESARYKPIVARTKVFIIDEVHMLSKSAFNALLKTLEEPPEHVKFIFATTEIRKVPVTVLSRCQRFDLRRVDVPVLAKHFKNIVTNEGAAADDEAINLIARAAEGSVRDGLSILDQGIAMSLGQPGASLSALQVRDMLGLADRNRIFDLLEQLASGAIAQALTALAGLNRDGAEPAQVLADLAEAVHQTARVKVVGAAAASDALSGEEKRRAEQLARELSVPLLSRLWQMLLKGHEEAARSGDPFAAAEMVLIRIAHTADLPSPDELIRVLGGDAPSRREPSGGGGGGRDAPSPAATINQAQGERPSASTRASDGGQPSSHGAFDDLDNEPVYDDLDMELLGPEADDETRAIQPVRGDVVRSFADVVELASRYREAKLRVDLEESVSLVKFDTEVGAIDIFLMNSAPQTLPNDLREKLNRWTARKWVVVVSKAAGEPTLGSVRREREARERAILIEHPAVKALLETFPEGKITAIKTQRIARDDDEKAIG